MLRVKGDIVFTKHQDGTMVLLSLLDSENSYFKVTGISQEIFSSLSTGKDLKITRDEILANYNVDEAILDKDIEQFLTYLKTNNIIEEK
jgi:hypothetical protein